MPMRRAGATREVHIGGVLLHAAVFGRGGREGRADGRMAVEESLTQTVARLFSTLDARGIDYLLVGGVALLQYVEGRNTEDLDLIFALSAGATDLDAVRTAVADLERRIERFEGRS